MKPQCNVKALAQRRTADPIDFIPGLFIHIHEMKGGIVSNKVEKFLRKAEFFAKE